MMRAWLTRAAALTRKETRQMLRDMMTLILGIVLPVVLLVLFGYGLSFNVNNTPVAVVHDTASPVTRELAQKLALSAYFSPVQASSWQQAEQLLVRGQVDGIVRCGLTEPGRLTSCAITVNGRDANKARIVGNYLTAAVSSWLTEKLGGRTLVDVQTRILYNEALESRYFLVPGVTVLVMTLIGAMLTSLVVAREWERGTWEALLATPVGRSEILISKTIPYFALGMVALAICLATGRYLFEVPIRGSLAVILPGSALYLVVCLGMGLLISAATRSQFLACMIVLVVSFMPTFLLSGLIFDTHSAPMVAYWISLAFPSTWFVELLTSEHLAGDVPELILRDMLILAADAAAFYTLAATRIRKSLE